MSDERRESARSKLRGTDYWPLWAKALRRLERNGLSLEGTPLRLDGLEPDQRRAIAGLLGLLQRMKGARRAASPADPGGSR